MEEAGSIENSIIQGIDQEDLTRKIVVNMQLLDNGGEEEQQDYENAASSRPDTRRNLITVKKESNEDLEK